jgi:hypothetical protein
MRDPPGSERERDSGVGWVGSVAAGLLPGFGPQVRPSWVAFLFFVLNIFLFLFSISFVSFAKMFQIISNFFLKFSKNQHIVLSHPVTCFQNKNRVLGKTSHSSK